MPRGDRTGPRGMGSMSGRAAGYCAGYNLPGFANPVPGGGMGFGMGRGFGGRGGGFGGRGFGGGGWGWRNLGWGVQPAPSQQVNPENEKQALREQTEMLQAEMDSIKKRLDEMEHEANKE